MNCRCNVKDSSRRPRSRLKVDASLPSLTLRVANGNSLAQVLGANAARGIRHLDHWSAGFSCQEKSTERSGKQREGMATRSSVAVP